MDLKVKNKATWTKSYNIWLLGMQGIDMFLINIIAYLKFLFYYK